MTLITGNTPRGVVDLGLQQQVESRLSDLRVSDELCQSSLIRSKWHPLRTLGSRDGPSGRRRGEMATSKKDATAASKQLTNPKSTKAQKSVAASDLSQAKRKGKK